MRARYSPIAPIRLLHQLHCSNLLGNYLLLLAHDVIASEHNTTEYRILLDSIPKGPGHKRFVIMDNSVVELGAAMDLGKVLEAADVVQANCIITPDVLGSFSRTQAAVEKTADRLLGCHYPLMRVPQGVSNKELFQCVDWLRIMLPADKGAPEYWGIPRWIANKIGSRIPLIQHINLTSDGMARIHLLGMSHDFEDDMKCTLIDNVIGIDSANPLVTGHLRIYMRQADHTHWDRGDYWERKELNDPMIRNVEYMRECMNNVG